MHKHKHVYADNHKAEICWKSPTNTFLTTCKMYQVNTSKCCSDVSEQSDISSDISYVVNVLSAVTQYVTRRLWAQILCFLHGVVVLSLNTQSESNVTKKNTSEQVFLQSLQKLSVSDVQDYNLAWTRCNLHVSKEKRTKWSQQKMKTWIIK